MQLDIVYLLRKLDLRHHILLALKGFVLYSSPVHLTYKMFSKNKLFSNIRIFTKLPLFLICFISSAHGMTVSGPITANNVTVSGDVTMSSMTVSSITVTGTLNVTNAIVPPTGRILQSTYTYTTQGTTTTVDSSWTPVSGMSQSITLSNASDVVRISLSGSLYSEINSTATSQNYGFITIMRNGTNLGDRFSGMAMNESVEDSTIPGFNTSSPVGITLIDLPGGATTYTYNVSIMNNWAAAGYVSFPDRSVGYLLLEEIGQ